MIYFAYSCGNSSRLRNVGIFVRRFPGWEYRSRSIPDRVRFPFDCNFTTVCRTLNLAIQYTRLIMRHAVKNDSEATRITKIIGFRFSRLEHTVQCISSSLIQVFATIKATNRKEWCVCVCHSVKYRFFF